MRVLIEKINERFFFFDYHSSHSQLLLRSNYLVGEEYHNIDILFKGVFFLQAAAYGFDDGFELYEGDDSDKERMTPLLCKDKVWRSSKVYVLKAKEQEYFICAVSVRIERNNFSQDKTSIPTPKE